MSIANLFHGPRVGGRGRSPRGGVSCALRPRYAACFLAALALTACAAQQSTGSVSPEAPGFLLGLWHGFILPVSWFISLFTERVAIYSVPNNGGMYDFGFILGVLVFGAGARQGHSAVRGR
jgi:hypothetical protein